MPVQEFARLDGAVNLSVIANATPEEFALSGVDCIQYSQDITSHRYVKSDAGLYFSISPTVTCPNFGYCPNFGHGLNFIKVHTACNWGDIRN